MGIGRPKKISLSLFDANVAQRIELRFGLDTLGDDPAAGIARKCDKRRSKRLARKIEVDVAGQRDVEFDQIGMDLQDVL